MNALVVDDSRLAATSLVRLMGRVDAKGSCHAVQSASEALEACARGDVDVAFLDIEMPGMNGLELAARLKVESPQTNVVFVTGYPEYALDAWDTQASAFLVKPVDEGGVRRALASLRRQPSAKVGDGLFVQCFGNFEVFYDGELLSWERQHTKELMAYLVDRRGAWVSNGELMTVLWEGLPDTLSRRSQLRTLVSDLRRTLEEAGMPDALVKRRGGVAISLAVDQVDYYSFLEHKPWAIARYGGEYMCQYSWAELTAASLGSFG